MPQKLIDPHILDVTAPATAVMFERIFGLDTAEFYKMRRLGSLPPNVFDKDNPATYEQCFQWLMNWLKGRAAFRSNDTVEAQRIQATKVDKQREIKLMLENLQAQQSLVSVDSFIEIFYPYAITLSQKLNILAKKHPELRKEIDDCQRTFASMGERLEIECNNEKQEWIAMFEDEDFEDEIEEEDFRDVPLDLPEKGWEE